MKQRNDRNSAAADAASHAISWALDPRDDVPPPTSTVYLTVADVASALRWSTKSVYRRIKSGALTAVPDGGQFRVHPSALRAYLQRRG
ncbi:MAG: hypothetical protein B7Z67_13990 [Acidiphilium sp. 21-60-14]|nr:MAG: hypothetical protein B7Z67_13990 [Acidiphilium sp. 21-60-14]OYV89053.1 MAG: hypothetical protein B7Z57_13860 [Acidiphilium sp. 37-60-79]OZB38726.1 MAG: hypothetical protein B7X48_12000 [Acidiphilium sp. 34-60-192]